MKKQSSLTFPELLEYCKKWISNRFFPFTIDDLKEDYLKEYEVLNSCYWIPNILKKLDAEGLIKFNDKLVKSRAKGNKGRYVKEWLSKEYSEKQSKKRLLEETAKSRELEKKQTNLEL